MENQNSLPTFTAEQFSCIFANTIKSIIYDEVKKAYGSLLKRIDCLEQQVTTFNHFDGAELEKKVDEIKDELETRINSLEECVDGTDCDDLRRRLDDIEDASLGDAVADEIENNYEVKNALTERVKEIISEAKITLE